MQESIYRGAVFGEIERGKSLDMADDSFGHVAGVEQQFIVGSMVMLACSGARGSAAPVHL